MPTPPHPLRRKAGNLSQEVCEHLESLIRNGQLRAQSKLPSESELMQNHQVSRTVIREALSQLQARGYVQTRQGIGTFVLPPPTSPSSLPLAESEQDIIAIMEVRISLESECAGLAAQRRTPAQLQEIRTLLDNLSSRTAANDPSQELDQQLHLLITQTTANPYMIEVLKRFSGALIPRMKLPSNYLESGQSTQFLLRRDTEHEEIYTAIARQDSAAASAAMRLHLSNSRERLITICTQNTTHPKK